MRTRLGATGAALCAISALALAGCSGSGDATPSDDPTTPENTSATPTADETTDSTTAQPSVELADPADYDTSSMFGSAEAYSFTDPDELYTCSLFGPGSDRGTTVGCHGTFDDSAMVSSPDGDGSQIEANGVVLTEDGAEFSWLGDPAFIPWDSESDGFYTPEVLPHGVVLEVGGISCTTDADDGVLCELGGHRMQVSTDAHDFS